MLTADDRQHLLDEGFSAEHIDQMIAWGVCSLTAPQAQKEGFYIFLGQGKKDFSEGLKFPFTESFGQIRCKRPLARPGKKPAKYLTQVGKKSQAWLPEGVIAVTEGYKDAARATVEGVPVGAMAGVSHYRKALPQGAGYTLIFDSDGWGNAQVFSNLFQGGLWLKGRINLLPPIEGEPKGGMCEWFNAGATAADVQALIAKAYTPLALLMEWPRHWKDLAPAELIRCIRVAIGLAAKHLKEDERQMLLSIIAENCPLGKRQLTEMLKWASQRQAKKAPVKAKADPKGTTTFKELESHESSLAKQYKKVRSVWGRQLRFNELSGEVELAGAELDLDEARMRLALEHDIELPAANVEPVLVLLAKANSYHPVVSYLDKVAEKHGTDTSILTGLAARCFGSTEVISERMLTCTLIAAVARVYEPGCKVDTALILQSPGHGKKKSSFFKELAGASAFDDSMGESSNKDEQLKLHLNWFVEWPELESIFGRKDQSVVKAFLSCATDLVRPPYAKKHKRMPRRSIIVGSSNRDDFLNDPTGNRRFWVIPVKKMIDLDVVRTERDRIWAAAVALYRSGEQWWLTDDEVVAASSVASEFEAVDTWAEAIENYVEGQRDYTNAQQDEWPTSPVEAITTQEVLAKVIKLPLAQQDRRAEMRVAAIMGQLAWEKRRVKRVYTWVRPLPEAATVEPVPVAEAAPPPPLVTTPDHPEWHPFEQGLVAAQSLSELRELKERTPEVIRKPCMNRWDEDGRYRWLEQKVQTLTQRESQ